MSEQTLWQWESGTDLTRKRCAGCSGPMMLDGAEAITYQSKTWHAHCLLNMLTEYHNGSKDHNLHWNSP